MKNTLHLLCSILLPFILSAQPVVHKGIFFRDNEGINSGFLADKVNEIQDQLNYLKSNEVNVNVLLMTKECPDLEVVVISGNQYWDGPLHSNNGEESSIWGALDNQSYILQFLPRQAKLYLQSGSGNSFWPGSGVDFDYPLLLHNEKYYCAIKKALNSLCIAKGLNAFDPTIDCEAGQPDEVEDAILLLPKTYLNNNLIDSEKLKSFQILAKTNFCTNLFYYAPYLHTRSTKNDLKDILTNTVNGSFALVTAIPDVPFGGNVFQDVLLDVNNATGYPDNCYPTLREITEQDRLEVLHKMHGGNAAGASSNLENVKSGSDYFLERLLSSASSPIPGNTNCEYGSYNGSNNANPAYNFVPDPNFQFQGPQLATPGSNAHVKWYNSFEGMPGGVVGSCTQAGQAAQSNGVNLQFQVASGCTPNTPQFEASRNEFEQTNPSGTSAVFWLYYDECDHRLYYDVKLPPGFTAGIHAGYGITNPDSIAAVRAAAEKMIEDILQEVSKMSSYDNANLDEGEYPGNMHHPGLAAFFGQGTACQGESPWKFGLREGHSFDAFGIAGECAVILKEIITDQSIPQRLWHPKPVKTCMLDMPGAAAGVIDGCLNLVNGKVWNLIGLMSAAVDLYKADAATRKAVLKELASPLNLILGQYPQNMQCIGSAECQEERIYCFTNLVTNAIFDIFGRSLVSMAGNIANVGAVVDDKLKMFVPDFGDKYNAWKRTLSEGTQEKLHQFMAEVSEAAKFKLAKRVTLNKIWQKFEAGQLPGITKEELQIFFERLPKHDQEEFYSKFDEIFTDELGDITDPNRIKAYLNDVINTEPVYFINYFDELPEKYFRAWEITYNAGKIHLRKNTDFLSTIDDFYDGTLSTKFESYGCTVFDEAVMRHYTSNYHYKLNLALVGAEPMKDEFLEFRDALNPALDKLPNYSGVIYRGLGSHESEKAMTWQVGDMIDNVSWDKKFVSTSIDPSEAEKFRIQGGGNVIVKFDPNYSGKLIEAISIYKNEKEVLYRTGKQFKVTKIEVDADDPSILNITVAEIL